MRLLDLLSQNRSTRVFANDGSELPSGHHFSRTFRLSPLGYVLSDALVRCATQLAYAEGDRLSSCLDLVRVPARSLWVEWADAPLTCWIDVGVWGDGPMDALGPPNICSAERSALRRPARHPLLFILPSPFCCPWRPWYANTYVRC